MSHFRSKRFCCGPKRSESISAPRLDQFGLPFWRMPHGGNRHETIFDAGTASAACNGDGSDRPRRRTESRGVSYVGVERRQGLSE